MTTTVWAVIAVAGFVFLIVLLWRVLGRRLNDEEAVTGESWGEQLTGPLPNDEEK
jgi:hypothetical protein